MRWNSTYVMIERALKLKRVLKSLSCEEENNFFTKYKISENEWENLSAICEFLKTFFEATLMVSQQSYPCLCVVIPLFDTLLKHLQNYKNSQNSILKNCSNLMELKLKLYENKLKNDLSFYSVILDPRLNIHYFKDSIIDEQFNTLKESFLKFYKTNYCNESLSTSKETNKETSSLMHSIYKKRKISDDEEVERYFEIALEDSEIDLIQWWSTHKTLFPHLYRMAFEILNIPATSVPSEQIFSKAGDVITKKRNRLSKDSIQAIICGDSMSKFFKTE